MLQKFRANFWYLAQPELLEREASSCLRFRPPGKKRFFFKYVCHGRFKLQMRISLFALTHFQLFLLDLEMTNMFGFQLFYFQDFGCFH